MPPDTVEQLTLLQQLQNKRDEGVNALGTLVDRRTEARTEFEQRSNGDEPTDEQRGVFTAAEEEFEREFNRRDAEIRTLDRRIRHYHCQLLLCTKIAAIL